MYFTIYRSINFIMFKLVASLEAYFGSAFTLKYDFKFTLKVAQFVCLD